jgi:hypothetical protein
MLRFDQVQSAFACPDTSMEGSVCVSRWHDLERQFFALDAGAPDASTMPDAAAATDVTTIDSATLDGGSPDTGSIGTEPAPPATGCHCAVPRRGGSGFAFLALAATLLARRKRRA